MCGTIDDVSGLALFRERIARLAHGRHYGGDGVEHGLRLGGASLREPERLQRVRGVFHKIDAADGLGQILVHRFALRPGTLVAQLCRPHHIPLAGPQRNGGFRGLRLPIDPIAHRTVIVPLRMQNLAGRFHIFEGPALKPHAAVGEIVMEPDELAVFPEFRDEIAVLRLGLELHAVAYRLFGRVGGFIGHRLQHRRILLVPRTEKAAGQQQTQGESHRIRADRPTPENAPDSLAAP